jgi:hypothetical protein
MIYEPARADAQVDCGQINFPKKEQQAETESSHCRDEKDGHRNSRVKMQRSAEEQYRDHGANEQRRDRAERDRAADQLGAP